MAKSSKSRTTRSSGGRSKPASTSAAKDVEDAEVIETKPEDGTDGGSGADPGTKAETGDPHDSTQDPGTDPDKVKADEAPQSDAAPGSDETLAGEPATLDAAETTAAAEADADLPADAPAEETPEGKPAEDISSLQDGSKETSEPAAIPEDTVAAKRSEAPVPTPPATVPPPRVEKRSALPMFFGGVIAALLGAVALYVSSERGWIDLAGGRIGELQATVEVQGGQIEELRAALDGMSGDIGALQTAQPDLSPVTDAVESVQASVDGMASDMSAVSDSVTALAARLDETDARLAEVETQPIPEAELPAEIVEAYENRLGEMQGAVEAQFDEMQAAQDEKLAAIEAALDDRLAEIDAAQGSAAQAEAAAAEAARQAEARAALADLEIAIDTGGEFTEALNALGEVTETDIPAILTDNTETGVPTLQDLKASFPAAAREALAVSIQPDPEAGASGRLGAFLRSQLGVRSLEPREGGDPDAVLSRAEAALAGNDIAGTIDLIGALPEDGQAEFADWVAQAQMRQNAQSAVATLSEQINVD